MTAGDSTIGSLAGNCQSIVPSSSRTANAMPSLETAKTTPESPKTLGSGGWYAGRAEIEWPVANRYRIVKELSMSRLMRPKLRYP